MSRICAIMSESAAARGQASARGTSAAWASVRRVRYDEVTTDGTALTQDAMRPRSLVAGKGHTPQFTIARAGFHASGPSLGWSEAQSGKVPQASERPRITLRFIQATS